MGNRSKKSSAAVSTSASMPLPRPKLATSFVPRPLTASEIAWLRQEGQEFQEAYSQIKASLAPSDTSPFVDCAPVDFGIVTALEEEIREFIDLLGQCTSHQDGLLTVYQCQYKNYRIVITFVGDMGEAHATRVTERMLMVWRPETIVAIGIAASVHDELRIGDVFIPDQAIQYIQNAKALGQGKPAEFRVVPGSPAYRADNALHSVARHIEHATPTVYQSFRDACARDLEQLLPDMSIRMGLLEKNIIRPKVKGLADGRIATGPIVSSTEAFSQWARSHDSSVKAIEMESAAVWVATQSRDKPAQTLAIRGVSDYGDERKKLINERGVRVLRRYAIRNAARFLLSLLDAKVEPGGRSND
jgi:nucleoside phosphorylase